jgi:hypothetical protein
MDRLLLIIVILLLLAGVGMLPHWGYTPQSWGYRGSASAGTVIFVIAILWLLGVF